VRNAQVCCLLKGERCCIACSRFFCRRTPRQYLRTTWRIKRKKDGENIRPNYSRATVAATW